MKFGNSERKEAIKMKKAKTSLINIMIFFLLIYAMLFIPCLWGQKPLVILSASMEPKLKVGGILYYQDCETQNFQVGDILVYREDNHNISHRIVEIVENKFITKGDGNNTVDLYAIEESQILGKGTNWSIPYLGYYADFIFHHKYIIYLLVCVLIIDYCFDLYKKDHGGFICQRN